VEITEEIRLKAQKKLLSWGLLDPPVDGRWGAQSKSALTTFQELFNFLGDGILDADAYDLLTSKGEPPSPQGQGLARAIAEWYAKGNWFIARGMDVYNITYIEGMSPDGSLNSDRLDEWNDLRILWQCQHSGSVSIKKIWKATSECGAYYTFNRMNAKGAARIAFGQYFAWQVGMHGSRQQHEALVQVAPITVHRDDNEDGKRTGDATDTGLFAVNQHAGMGATVGRWSAGCLVVPDFDWHAEFMRIIKCDRRYKASNGYLFGAGIIPGDRLTKYAEEKGVRF
jgi:hypothetical protein